MKMKVELIEEEQLADIVYLPVSTDEAKDLFGEEFDFIFTILMKMNIIQELDLFKRM